VIVHEDLCAACGICVGSCHSSNPFRHAKKELVTGIDMPQEPINKIREHVSAAVAQLEGENKVIVFGCNNAIDFAGLKASNIAVSNYFCVGMIPPTMIEYALKQGADGVFVTGCRTGDCYYRHGNRWFDERLDNSRLPGLRKRADRRRINVFRAAETDCKKLRKELAHFQQTLAQLKDDEANAGEAADE